MTTQTFTADDLLHMPRDGNRYELVAGELKMMSPSGFQHGYVALELGALLRQFVRQHQLGSVTGAETGFRLASNPDTVLAPDVAFVCQQRLEQIGYPRGYFPGAPDLAVEVRSPGDRPAEVEEKAQRWLAAGARAVWVVDPVARDAVVYTSDGQRQPIAPDGHLEGGSVLPGFRCLLGDLFPPAHR